MCINASVAAFCIPPSAYSYTQMGRSGNPFFSDSGGKSGMISMVLYFSLLNVALTEFSSFEIIC